MAEFFLNTLSWVKGFFLSINWKDFAETIEAFTTAAALVAGGIWAYLRFIKNRLPHPWADLNHEFIQKTLPGQKKLLHVIVEVSNTGGVLLPITHIWTKVFKVAPVSGSELDQLEEARGAGAEIDWPEMGCYEVKYELGKARIEPSELERFHFDFIIPAGIKTVSVYSYFENAEEEELGWNRTSIIDIEEEKPDGN